MILWLPFISAIIAVLVEFFIPTSSAQPSIDFNYYLLLNSIAAVITLFLALYSVLNKRQKNTYIHKAPFVSGVILLFTLLNVITGKLSVLPTVYFPSFARILSAIVDDRALIVKCLFSSARLLIIGFAGGTLAGVITGVAIGFNEKISYWLSPVFRVLGPIPSTAWIPLALVCFPSAVAASCFLIGLAVWFPVNVMTSNGIRNINKSMFEVSSTLGANLFYRVFKVGIPAAMPNIFLGIFNGSSSAFITLMTAEMIGAKYGIGWYVNWQKEMMSYANVYGGLIIIAVVFSLLVGLQFKVRDKVLIWQKGMIKW